MRTLLIAGLGATLAIAGAADAQRGRGTAYPVRGAASAAQPLRAGAVQSVGEGYRQRGPVSRRMRDDRWIEGKNAPGGWSAYRRPHRGGALPDYWTQPGFAVANWRDYGLSRPPAGYGWSRYYDDAVLIDASGLIYDAIGGLDWGGYRDDAPDGRDVQARRGGRLDDRLIGAGVGDVRGYANDRAEDRGRRGPPPGDPRSRWISSDGSTVVTTTAAGGASSTVVVQGTPLVTTTTTGALEDPAAYSGPAYRNTYGRRAERPSKTLCRC